MPTDQPPCRSLREYVVELVTRLGRSDPDALARLRRVVGARHARLDLDHEAVEVFFDHDRLEVREGTGGPVHGEGGTDRATVLDLLDGYLEVDAAILEGRLRIVGEIEDVIRMVHAIEIVLDGSARDPALQRLALDFRADPCRAAPRQRLPSPESSDFWYPAARLPAEDRLLGRLGLLSRE